MTHDEVNSLNASGIPGASQSPAERVADLLHAVHRQLRHGARHELRDTGLTPGQWRALRVISWCDEPLRMSSIAERLHIAKRSATQVVDELEGLGLVARADDPTDRRAVVVSATPAGARVLREAGEARRRASAAQMAVLDDRDLDQLAALLERLLHGTARGAGGGDC